jgi:hypothetical protein
MPVLERLYTVQKAQGAVKLEIVLVSRCREAKAMKYYSLTMPWLSMWHDANNKVGMKACTTALMAKFGVSTIPALILLDEQGRVICPEARRWVNVDPKGKTFPWQETAEVPMPGPAARAVVNFDLPPAEQPKLLVPPAQRQRANRSPRKFLGPKQDPVSAVHSAGGRGEDGERLANGPDPPARPMARVNFHLPPTEQPNQPVSPEKIQPRSQAPIKTFAARATAAPKTAPPPSFPSHCARAVQGRGAVEQADVHTRTRNRAVQRKLDPPDIVATKLPPDKPNLRFTPEIIPQGELTSLMQPQSLAEVHPFVPTLRKWKQGIPVECGSDWDQSVVEATVERGPHPTARTPESIALFIKDIEYQIKASFCRVIPLEGTQALPASEPQDLTCGGSTSSGTTGENHP